MWCIMFSALYILLCTSYIFWHPRSRHLSTYFYILTALILRSYIVWETPCRDYAISELQVRPWLFPAQSHNLKTHRAIVVWSRVDMGKHADRLRNGHWCISVSAMHSIMKNQHDVLNVQLKMTTHAQWHIGAYACPAASSTIPWTE